MRVDSGTGARRQRALAAFGELAVPNGSRALARIRRPRISRDLAKTLSYLVIHLGIGFTVAYLFTGSLAIASGIALIEPLCNAVAYFFHEKAWNAQMTPRNMLEILVHRHPVPKAQTSGSVRSESC